MEHLVESLQQGNKASMQHLLDRYGPMIRYVLRGILPNEQEQEDCFSEVSMLIWEKIRTYDPNKGSLQVWLTALSRNAALNWNLRWQREQNHRGEATQEIADYRTPETALLEKERTEHLKKIIKSLSNEDKHLFYRKYSDLQSTAQIAADYGTTQRAIEGRLYRIRKRLQKEMGGVRNE